MKNIIRPAFKAAALALALSLPATITAQAQTASPPPAGAFILPDVTHMSVEEKKDVARATLKSIQGNSLTFDEEIAAIQQVISFTTPPEDQDLRWTATILLSQITKIRPQYADLFLSAAEMIAADPSAEIRNPTVYIINALPPGDDAATARKLDILDQFISQGDVNMPQIFSALKSIADSTPGHQDRIIAMIEKHILHPEDSVRRYGRNILAAIVQEGGVNAARAMDIIKIPVRDPYKKVTSVINDPDHGSSQLQRFAFEETFISLREMASANLPETTANEIALYLADMAKHPDSEVRYYAAQEFGYLVLTRMEYYDEFLDLVDHIIANDPSTAQRWTWEYTIDSLWNSLQLNSQPTQTERVISILSKALQDTRLGLRHITRTGLLIDIGLAERPQLEHAMIALRAEAQEEGSPFRATLFRQIQKIFKNADTYRDEIYGYYTKSSSDKDPAVAVSALEGVALGIETDDKYKQPAFDTLSTLIESKPQDLSVRVAIVNTMGSVFSHDATRAPLAFNFMRDMGNDVASSVRQASIRKLANGADQRAEYAQAILQHAESMLSYTDQETRFAVIDSIGQIGEKVESETLPAADLLMQRADDIADQPNYRARAITEMGDIGAAKSSMTDKSISLLVPLTKNNDIVIASAALNGIIKIGNSQPNREEQILAIIEPFESSAETDLRNIVTGPLKQLRELLGFRGFRQSAGDEAALAAQLPDALKDLALAQKLLPQAIALLQGTKDNAIMRQKAAEIVGPLGHAHASLAVEAATVLADVITRDEPGNQDATLLAMLQKMGLIGITHEAATPIVITAAAHLTGNKNPTLSGMAVTAIGLMGVKYPASAMAAATAALCPVAGNDNAPGRAARAQLDKFKPPAQCPAP